MPSGWLTSKALGSRKRLYEVNDPNISKIIGHAFGGPLTNFSGLDGSGVALTMTTSRGISTATGGGWGMRYFQPTAAATPAMSTTAEMTRRKLLAFMLG